MNTEQFGQFARAFGLRRSHKEKKRFVENLTNLFAGYGYSVNMYEDRIGLRKITHVVFGDISSAKYVYAAGYDTGERIVLGNGKYWPLEESRNKSKAFVNLTLYMLISLAIVVVGVLIIRNAFTYEGWKKILNIAAGVGFVLLGNEVAKGLPNRTTFAKTSSIFLLFELADSLRGTDSAFIFLDYGAFSRIGPDFLQKQGLVKEGQTVIYADCFSDGDRLLIGYGSNVRKQAEAIKEKYKKKKVLLPLGETENCRFAGLDNWIVLCNVYKDSDDTLYVDNVRTDDDLTVDPETIDAIAMALKEMRNVK